ncbi:MAG: ATP-binding protein [Deltaproteobacteria bacterium]|nr:ATP-binding protein [Deltaproteobacteria bacterium]
MKEKFAITKNVKRFLHGVELAQTPIKGRIGNMLAFGPPGTGKTDVGQWYSAQHDVPYIRAKDISSRRSLLSNIVAELGIAAMFRADDLFNQIVEQLIERPRPIIIDEVDYLIRGGAVEVLRDINDMTNTPVIMMGMEHAEKSMRRFRHLYDRFAAIVRFELFDNAEIHGLAGEICGVKLSDCAVNYIAQAGQGKLRITTTWFSRAENLARRNKLEEVTADHLKSFVER